MSNPPAPISDTDERSLPAIEREPSVEALQPGRELLNDILESLDEALTVGGSDWRIWYMNQRGLALTQKRREEVIGRDLWKTFPVFLHTSVESTFRRAMTERVPARFEVFGPQSKRWYETVVSPFPNGISIVSRDIHDRRQAEEALRTNERMLAQSQRLAHIGSRELDLEDLEDLNRNELRWSDEAFRIFGFEPGAVEATNDLFFQVVHPDDRAAIVAAVDEALREGKPYEVEHRVRRPDGTERIVHEWASLERNGTGRPVRMLGTCQDVTARRRAEEAARAAREQLQFIADTMPVHVSWCSKDGRYLWVNKSNAERFGLTPEQVAGRHIAEVMGQEAYEAIRPYVDQVLGGQSVEYEAEVPYERLGRRWMHVVYEPTFDAAGRTDGWIGVVTDVTGRRKAEEERNRALAELREADRQKDEFLAMLAHELRNPLAPVTTAIEILRLRGPADRLLEQQREVIARQVQHMKRLLDVSRVSRGKIQLRNEPLDLGFIMQQAVELSRPLIQAKQHDFQMAMPHEALWLEGDPTRLTQVFANLLNNAAKYTDRGGHIQFVAQRDGQAAVISVRDDGIGLEPEMLRRAFDLFTQGDRSLDRSQGGLGIGLTMVRSLVQMHGGTVEAFSEGPGHGSELVVRLPLLTDSVFRPSGAAAPAAARTERPRRVLIVDDHVDSVSSLAMLLQLLGHEVRTAHDGQAALQEVRQRQPELVLLDIGLPEMDVYEVAAHLRRELGNSVMLVALTGYGQEEDRRRSLESGFDEHLVKPFALEALHAVFARLDGPS